MDNLLIGMRVIVCGNEFENERSSAIIRAVDESESKILLELNEAMVKKGTVYRHIVASPRLSKDSISSLATTGSVGCALTWIPEEKYNSHAPMDLSWWRGGAAAIADLYRLK